MLRITRRMILAPKKNQCADVISREECFLIRLNSSKQGMEEMTTENIVNSYLCLV